MSIFDKLFSQQPQQEAQPQPQQQQEAQPNPENNTIPNATNVPPANAQGEESPLANYADLWQTTSNKEGEQDSDQPLTIDQTKLAELSKKLDFTSGITADHLTAISNGGEEAVRAFQDALNNSSRSAFLQSLTASSNLINSASDFTLNKVSETIPKHIKQATISDTVRGENPLFTNPAVAPMLGMLEQQLTAKYPDASPAEISAHAKQYLEGFASAVMPQSDTKTSKAQNGSDFSSFL